jgi:hypothetical protein
MDKRILHEIEYVLFDPALGERQKAIVPRRTRSSCVTMML